MAKPEKLPSGSWRVRVYDKNLKKQVSFTAETKTEAELLAAEYKAGLRSKPSEKTVGEAIDEYIKLKDNILSPTTIYGYQTIRKGTLAGLSGVRLRDLNNEVIQRHINIISLDHPPKTVRNAYNLLSAVLNIYLPDFRVRVKLPSAQKKIKQLPDERELLHAIIGSNIELPCLLAMWQGMRMSEIKGVKRTDIKDGVLTIRSTVVTVAGKEVKKESTKTYDSTRQLELPPYILNLISNIPQDQEYLVPTKSKTIYDRFKRLIKKYGLPDMTFHDLRHMNASIGHAIGIQDKYIQERGGWSSDHIMKTVYTHTFTKERLAADHKINSHFEDLIENMQAG